MANEWIEPLNTAIIRNDDRFDQETQEKKRYIERDVQLMRIPELRRRLKGFMLPFMWHGQILVIKNIVMSKINPEEPLGYLTHRGQNRYIRRVEFKYLDQNNNEIPDHLIRYKVRPILSAFVSNQVFFRTQQSFNELWQYFYSPKTEEEHCPVCFGDFEGGVYRLTPCGHGICRDCVPDIVPPHRYNRCPVCRHEPVSQTRISKRKSKKKSKRRKSKKKSKRSKT